MHTVLCNFSALAVATLYYYWRSYHQAQQHRLRLLRERVTYMLWVMANSVA
jgi:hypothetical protein